jgi:hypothetical protein
MYQSLYTLPYKRMASGYWAAGNWTRNRINRTQPCCGVELDYHIPLYNPSVA